MMDYHSGAWYWGWPVTKGSSKSGNWKHRGRKGQRGGSLPGAGHGAIGVWETDSPEEKDARIQAYRQARDVAKEAVAARRRMLRDVAPIIKQISQAKARAAELDKQRSELTIKHLVPLYDRMKSLRDEGKRPDDPEYMALKKEAQPYETQKTQLFKGSNAELRHAQNLQLSLRQKAVDSLSVPEGQRANFNLDIQPGKDLEDTVGVGAQVFSQLVGTGTVDGKTLKVIETSKSRASYNDGTKIVSLTSYSKTASVVHEMGHWLEDHDPVAFDKALSFWQRRTRGQGFQQLNKIFPHEGYPDHEVTKPDKFMDPYSGKVYTETGKGITATEIISVGLEKMYIQPVAFAKNDPEYFDFMYSTLRGK